MPQVHCILDATCRTVCHHEAKTSRRLWYKFSHHKCKSGEDVETQAARLYRWSKFIYTYFYSFMIIHLLYIYYACEAFENWFLLFVIMFSICCCCFLLYIVYGGHRQGNQCHEDCDKCPRTHCCYWIYESLQLSFRRSFSFICNYHHSIIIIIIQMVYFYILNYFCCIKINSKTINYEYFPGLISHTTGNICLE